MGKRPEYEQVRAYKKAHGWELMDRFGAHALGIGRWEEDGEETDEPALLVYVENRKHVGDRVPDRVSFRPPEADEDVEVRTRIIESPQAQIE